MLRRAVSVSLGSRERNFTDLIEFPGGVAVNIERVGTDGDVEEFRKLLRHFDGQVDAIGFGGCDIWVWVDNTPYALAAPEKLRLEVHRTPVVDGSGLKHTLEAEAIHWVQEQGLVDFITAKTFLVCGVDRWGMARAISAYGGPIVFGDLMFALNIAVPIRSLRALRWVARFLLPFVRHMSMKNLYPTGDKQKERLPRFEEYYAWADIVCGDNLYIMRHMPLDLRGTVIITNTTTQDDREEYRRRGVRLLITTTPTLPRSGRSPGTNAFEAAIIAASGRDPKTLTRDNYLALLKQINWQPTVHHLNAA